MKEISFIWRKIRRRRKRKRKENVQTCQCHCHIKMNRVLWCRRGNRLNPYRDIQSLEKLYCIQPQCRTHFMHHRILRIFKINRKLDTSIKATVLIIIWYDAYRFKNDEKKSTTTTIKNRHVKGLREKESGEELTHTINPVISLRQII